MCGLLFAVGFNMEQQILYMWYFLCATIMQCYTPNQTRAGDACYVLLVNVVLDLLYLHLTSLLPTVINCMCMCCEVSCRKGLCRLLVLVFVCVCVWEWPRVTVCVTINPLHHHYTLCMRTSHWQILTWINNHMRTRVNVQDQTRVIASNAKEMFVDLYVCHVDIYV